MDPEWNPFKYYSQFRGTIISIYGKGVGKILRQHFKEKQDVRKDHRLRSEYLYKVDPVTKSKIHQSRGNESKLLTPYQLELELPKFIKAELVEIGQKLPFYDEYLSGMD